MVAFVVGIMAEKMGGEDPNVGVVGWQKMLVMALVGLVVRTILVDFNLVDNENIVGDVDDDGKTELW